MRTAGVFAVALLMSLTAHSAINILPNPGSVERLGGACSVRLAGEVDFLPLNEGIVPEGYELEVTPGGVVVRASSESGRFYAKQTLQQLVDHAAGGEIPCVRIVDQPKYAWRSFMIDSGRQFQRLETIKGLLDRMAMLKMNVFHWHLTENDGWRIEIKKYPKLTEVGAFVADGEEQHGFYTQKDIREIVAYAAERHITVVPEIDVPGHSEAALKAYPSLTCSREAPKPVKKGFSPYLYCGGRDSVVEFLCNVLDEVCELFPSEYIHIGGDEAPKSEWKKCTDCQAKIKEMGLKDEHELQIELTNRLARHLAAKGRKAICWGDVVTLPGQELEKNVVVHWWNYRRGGDKALREGIKRGLPVIANSNYYTYLNFPQKHTWRNYRKDRLFDFQTCYEKNPSDIRNPTAQQSKALLGMGCCLWTDHGLTEEWLDRRLYPRIYAMAEQMWSTAERLPFTDFKNRVYAKQPILQELGIGGDWDEEY
ncbi:Beta-hexosaminidase [Pontiella sulfatireligans]|uniref:beta-N-acetylhexosaminidase n=2 Tax=Pontiella sulfatireligans TaxID=2750658 RepID=A0A6C2UJM4_9BACT|nr:Beta-hexosaminidase [Pontiella sulfatireligans]